MLEKNSFISVKNKDLRVLSDSTVCKTDNEYLRVTPVRPSLLKLVLDLGFVKVRQP